MRSRRSANDQVAEVARRRLELLSAELAEIRPDPVDPPRPDDRDGSGEPFSADTVAGRGRHAHRPVGLGVAVAGWAHDRMPPTLQGRVRMTVAHLAVVALVVVAAAGVTVWWVSRADDGVATLPAVARDPVSPASVPSGGALATPSMSVPAGSGAPAVPGPAATPTGSIVVDVTGKVRRPGIATLPAGSRVVDALEAAGGPRRGARLGSLNMARVLTDGEQIVVGVRAPPGVAASAASAPTSAGSTPLVDINTASQAELETLPEIGPVTAQSILDFRAQNGSFTAVDELLEVSGIGEATLAKIAPYVTV